MRKKHASMEEIEVSMAVISTHSEQSLNLYSIIQFPTSREFFLGTDMMMPVLLQFGGDVAHINNSLLLSWSGKSV